jgi:hypothetical protein
MKKLLNNSTFYFFRLMFRLAPVGVVGSVILKGVFILLQISAIWIMISWISGVMLPGVKGIVQLEVSSYIYPIISGCLLVLASLTAFCSKWLALKSIKRLEQHVAELTRGKDLLVSDYRNLSKLLLALIDSLVPFVFIFSVLFAWAVVVHELIPLFFISLVAVALLFRIGIRYSRGVFKTTVKKVNIDDYFGSDEHKKFHQILMVPHYISLTIFILISIAMVIVAISLRSSDNLISFGFLPVATALAILQFKSFVGLLVRIGVYSENAIRITRFIITPSN